MKKYIGIVGLPGAGKSTALEVAKEFGEIFVMGDIIREEAISQGLSISSENLGMVAKQLRHDFGSDIVAKRIIDKILKSSSNLIIIDGIRSNFEVDLFKEKFPLEIIAIIADDEKRHEWLISRKREDDSTTIDKIVARDNREIGFGVKDVIDQSSYKIKNDGSIDELKKKCKALFEKLIN